MTRPSLIGRPGLAFAALVYAALVAHLLFIPYAYAPLSLDEALQRFGQVEWMNLGSDQNVALVSRALMWGPLGLLLAMWVAPRPRRGFEWPAWVVASVLGCAWAAAVNFGQLWFPGRTFNLNNFAAEACGGILGALVWSALGARGGRWRERLALGGFAGLRAALGGYVVVYLLAILTPYDFVASGAELLEKIDSPKLYGLWLAPVGCGPFSCGIKFGSVVLACVPCGWWFAARRPQERAVWLPATLLALLVGAGVEGLHFLMVSGVSQGASVLARAGGMALGALSFPLLHALLTRRLGRAARPVACALLLALLPACLYLGGWSRSHPLAWEAGLARAGEIVWMPFFQEYYAPYQSTMLGAIAHVVAYAPFGAVCWLWSRDRRRVPLLAAGCLAAAVCGAVEWSKLWLADRLPDCTDPFIAALAAMAALALLRVVSAEPVETPSRRGPLRPDSSRGTRPRSAPRLR